MCDTLVALGAATADGSTLLAKNSDRHPNEAQAIDLHAAVDHPSGTRVRCTYLEIEQAARTHAVLLCRPFWMWGAEMGVNEHGVVIANEAVFTREPQQTEPALTGMDLLRLGLERARSAEEALAVITELLGVHGQGGECGYDGTLRYHNGFLIADRERAWVLETAGRHWVAERVSGVRSISNGLSIRGVGDRRSSGLVAHAKQRGWSDGDLDFATDVRDRLYSTFAGGVPRRARSDTYLCALAGRLSPPMLMAYLRSHAAGAGGFDPATGFMGADICMHAGPGPIRIGHTVGSMVCRIDDEGPTVWLTGTSTPCTSIFAPVWLSEGLPSVLAQAPSGEPDDTLFWRHERFARAVQRDYRRAIGTFAADRDALELELYRRASSRSFSTSESCFADADAARARWMRSVSALGPSTRASERWSPYRWAWRRFDRRAGL